MFHVMFRYKKQEKWQFWLPIKPFDNREDFDNTRIENLRRHYLDCEFAVLETFE